MIRPLLFCFLAAAAELPAQGPDFDLPLGVPQLELVAKSDSNDPAAHYNLAIGYWKYERYDAADSEFRLAIRLDPDYAPSFVGLFALTQWRWAPWRYRYGRPPAEAEQKVAAVEPMFWHAIVTDPLVDLMPLGVALAPVSIDREGRAYLPAFERGAYSLFDGDYQTSLVQTDAVIRLFLNEDSVPGDLLIWRALAAEHLGLDSLASVDFRRLADRATARENSNAVVHVPVGTAVYDYLLALTLIRLNRAPEAVSRLHAAVVADAGLYEAHSRLAEIAEAGEDWDDAVAERRAAVDANPENAGLLMLLGATLMKANRLPEAETALRQAVSQNPRDFSAVFVLGLIEAQLGKNDEARKAFTDAIALTPSRFQKLLDDAHQRLASLPP